ncbi:hypothetical protein NE236_40475 [Actinoallomurus purpureus]|uniref:hypothetical protein n=1 Tax=Actinoallomurus purpureus TaxID=478114 RepID=UPI0020926302|nr:hypothetical protein [Actinoallomurus purpureus]MCO6011244.1 hypothetical protein [Actinoallomurus purpureus]
MYTGPRDEEPDERDAELLRYERERRERAGRRDATSWRFIAWVMAGGLALLSYDSGGAALDAHRSGRPWLYPATVSVGCALGLVGLVAWALRRR